LVSEQNIDKDRIYVTGWSNGGFMTWRLVCELGDQIRAAAPFAASFGLKHFTREQAADPQRETFTILHDENNVHFDTNKVTP
jgi:poly(3-hydroxybutyrate) depolymerase